MDMDMDMQQHSWSDLSNIPAKSGVYAWYYTPEITNYDLAELITLVSGAGDVAVKRRLVREFLSTRIFSFFREQPYTASISGSLKPRYSGKLDHEIAVSESLVERIADAPERLKEVREILRSTSPHFASPIYIGMAANLRSRVATHKRLIEQFRSDVLFNPDSADEQDAGFGRQVALRRIPPERLVVYTRTTTDIHGIANDVENILNRIYYPVLGRN
jgi:hypothetical protein